MVQTYCKAILAHLAEGHVCWVASRRSNDAVGEQLGYQTMQVGVDPEGA